MAYRNGTYIAFHANNTSDPTQSDMKYYNTLKMWKVRDDGDFTFINSHEKTGAVRDTSKKETLRRSLISRMNNSKHLLLIIGTTTRFDTDWIPFEIAYAANESKIPIIAVYTGYERIMDPAALSALTKVINSGSVGVIHVPFKQAPIADAISQFNHDSHPATTLNYYSQEAYSLWGLI